MSEFKYAVVAHMGHNAPWLNIQTLAQIKYRRTDIEANKPEREVALRLKLLKIIEESLPPELQTRYDTWAKAHAEWMNLGKTYVMRQKITDAELAWEGVINSPEGVAFHAEVCGCDWTPERPDILLQLEEKDAA